MFQVVWISTAMLYRLSHVLWDRSSVSLSPPRDRPQLFQMLRKSPSRMVSSLCGKPWLLPWCTIPNLGHSPGRFVPQKQELCKRAFYPIQKLKWKWRKLAELVHEAVLMAPKQLSNSVSSLNWLANVLSENGLHHLKASWPGGTMKPDGLMCFLRWRLLL